jgi:hypothetical protein
MKLTRAGIIVSMSKAAAAMLLIGCRASAPTPAPDRAAVAVQVRAEPKKGWKDPAAQGSYDPVAFGGSRAFRTINYANLDDIVVWIETPGAPQPADAQHTLTLDIGRPSGNIHASGLRDSWRIRNSAPEPLPAFARYESGRVVDLGTVSPGGEASHRPVEAGFVEIVCDPRPEAVAQVYVVPIPTAAGGRAQVVANGARVVFNDLAPGGTARVACWHPRLPGSATDVPLVGGVTSNATLIVGVNQLPKITR